MSRPSPRLVDFERALEGAVIASPDSPLFKLPAEILTIIANKLVTIARDVDLASLALTNSDCRQLARSVQFCSVNLGGEARSESMVDHLHREAAEIRQTPDTRSLHLGVCIRDLNLGHLRRVDEGIPLSMISILSSLPHLDSLRLFRIRLNQHPFNTLIKCPIKHLELCQVPISELEGIQIM